METTKICSICNATKSLTEYDFRKENNKYRSYCKSCRKQKGIQYNLLNKEKRRLDSEKRRKENPEKEREISRKSRLKHREKRLFEMREYYKKNKDSFKEKSKQFYIKNPNWRKEYANKNRKRINEYGRNYIKKRCKEDPVYRIRKNIRGRFKRALQGNYKNGSAIKALGCEIHYLKYYLEDKFSLGMTWDNYGKLWHIDHIIPISSFDLTKEEEIAKACHYTNLQPLWAKDNIKKGNKTS